MYLIFNFIRKYSKDMPNILIFFILIFVSSTAYSFEVFGRIPWSIKQKESLITDPEEIKEILLENNIKKIDVVYHNRMLTNNEVDPEKIKKLALESLSNPDIPISFDYELGNRFKPETILPKILEIIDLYRFYGGKAQVGVYALLPQNTYGGAKLTYDQQKKYVELNKKYEILAKKINFLSPSLYFYDGKNMENWKKSVDFNIGQSIFFAKKYGLKIYPYITNTYTISKVDPVTKSWRVMYLSCSEMNQVVTYIRSRGADGIIIWNSSNVLDQYGKKPVINLKNSWFEGTFKTCN